jgi:type 1 fimbriae regulatory protein FimB/type 1 fimbriae regulatory protein FimE
MTQKPHTYVADITRLPKALQHLTLLKRWVVWRNDGQDTRAIQGYLGHRSIVSTQRYTALAPDRFKRFWKD